LENQLNRQDGKLMTMDSLKRSRDSIPCENCICLAICRNKRGFIETVMQCKILGKYIYREGTIQERWYVERFHLARSICGNAPDRIASEEFLDHMNSVNIHIGARRMKIEWKR